MRVLLADEIFVEPMRLFYLEAYSRYGDEFFRGDVDDEAADGD
jgi:hypothetical protein